MAVETKKTEKIDVSIKSIIHAGIMLALMFGFRLIPPFGTVTEYGVAVLGVFLGLLWGWTFLGILWPSLIGMFGLAFAGYGTVEKVALAMLNNSTVFMMLVGGLAFMCLGQSKAADWLMAKIVNNKLGKKSPVYTVMIIMFATLIINCMGATWIFLIAIWPIMVDMLKKCGYRRGEKFCIMFLTGYLSSIQMGMAFKPFAGWGLMTAGTMQKLTQTEISYGGWMMTMVILIIVIGVTYPFFMKLCGCDFSKLQDVDIVKTFGVDPSKKMNLTQKVVMTAMGIFLAVVIICSVFGAKLGPAYKLYTQITIGGFMVLFWIAMVIIKVDGKPMLDMKEAAKTFSWDMLFLIALALLISSVLTSADTGISAWVSSKMVKLFVGRSSVVFLIAVGAITMIASNFANNIAVCYVMMNIVASMYLNGFEVNILAVSMLIAVCSLIAFYIPASSLGGAMMHSCEMTTAKDIYRYMPLSLLYFLVVLLTVFVVGGMIFG